MADILTLVFRTFMSQMGRMKPPSPGLPPPAAPSALLVGARSVSGSVLLLAAVTAASQAGRRVVFFSPAQIQSLPGTLQRLGPNMSPQSLKKIQFFYPRTLAELLQQVAGLHEAAGPSSTPPSLIIVDQLESFVCSAGLHPGEQSCAAHLSALLCDTAAFFSQVLEQRAPCSSPCRILASFQKEMDPGQAGGEASAADPVLDVLDRYFQSRCTLAQDSGYEAAAAGLQEVWHIYLSGTTDCDDVVQEWQLLISPDGLMEFKWV